MVPLAELRQELDWGRELFRAHEYEKSESVLGALADKLERIVKEPLRHSDTADWALLLASTRMALGRAMARRDKRSEAQVEFGRAVELFEHWLPATKNALGEVYRDYGMALQRCDREEEAINNLERAVSLGAGDAETHRYLGVTFQAQGLMDRAEAHLRRALELAPDDPDAFVTLADILVDQQRIEEALPLYVSAADRASGRPNETLRIVGKALKTSPKNPEFLARKANALQILGRYQEAVAIADEVLATAPDMASAYAVKASALTGLGRFDDALAAVDEVLRLSPEYPFALALRAELLFMQGKLDEALAEVEHALQLNSWFVFALSVKAEVLRAMNRLDESLKALDQILQADPGNVAALVMKGETLRGQGRLEEALPVFDEAIGQEKRADILAYKAEVLRGLANGRQEQVALNALEEAVGVADEALAMDPDLVFALGTKGAALISLGRMDDALQALNDAIGLAPTYVFALANKADAHRIKGEYPDALQAAELALQNDPSNPTALAVKGEVLRLSAPDRKGEALEALNQALKAAPKYQFALARKGYLLRAIGKTEECVQVLQEALEEDPSDTPTRAELADALRDLGRHDEALPHLDMLSEQTPNDVDPLRKAAYSLLVLRRTTEAIDRLDKALKISPDDSNLHADRGYALVLAGEMLDSRDELGRAIQLDEKNAWALTVQGHYLTVVADFNGAIPVLDEAIQLYGPDEGDAWTFGLKGWSHQSLAIQAILEAKDPNEHATAGFSAYGSASELEPEDWAWQGAMGDILRIQGRVKEADERFALVLDKLGDAEDSLNAEDLMTLGWCSFQLGRYEDAIRVFLAQGSVDPDSVVSVFNLALAAMCNGQYPLGLRQYERGIEMARAKHPLIQRGLLLSAQQDLLLSERTHFQQTETGTAKKKGRGGKQRKDARGPEPMPNAAETRQAEQMIQSGLKEAFAWTEGSPELARRS